MRWAILGVLTGQALASGAAAECPTRASLATGYSITWNTGMVSRIMSSDGIIIEGEDRMKSGAVLKRRQHLGIVVLETSSAGGMTKSVFDPPRTPDVPLRAGEETTYAYRIEQKPAMGAPKAISGTQTITRSAHVDVTIGGCSYAAATIVKSGSDGEQHYRQEFVYIPELLHHVELHSEQTNQTGTRRLNLKAIAIDALLPR